MTALHLIEIALAPLVTFALLWVARALSMRIGRRLPANAFTRFLYRVHRIRPITEADRRDWQAVFWPLFVFVLFFVIVWYGYPDLH